MIDIHVNILAGGIVSELIALLLFAINYLGKRSRLLFLITLSRQQREVIAEGCVPLENSMS